MIRLAVRVARSQADPVLAELLELVPAGLEERDVDADAVECALYGAAWEQPDVGALRAVAGGALVDVSTSEVDDGLGWPTGAGRSTSGRCACGRHRQRNGPARSTS